MSEKKPNDLRISNVPPFGLRMLPELRSKIERSADANGRSMNAEITTRLEASFSSSEGKDQELEELRERNQMNERLIQTLTALAQKKPVPPANESPAISIDVPVDEMISQIIDRTVESLVRHGWTPPPK